jgi:putative acetyltransferase
LAASYNPRVASTAELHSVCFAIERPDQLDVVPLIDALDAYQRPLYPAESHHGVDIATLGSPGVLFAVARLPDGAAVGCGAVVLTPEFAELKRMYTTPSVRGRGIGRALLAFLEREALARGASRFTLETGYLQVEALRLYERAGYSRCAPFGHYLPDPNSVFLSKTLGRPAAP